MKIEEYDHVILKDGRTATIVEIFKEGEAYLVDVDLPGPDWDTIDVTYDDIESVVSNEMYRKLTSRWAK